MSFLYLLGQCPKITPISTRTQLSPSASAYSRSSPQRQKPLATPPFPSVFGYFQKQPSASGPALGVFSRWPGWSWFRGFQTRGCYGNAFSPRLLGSQLLVVSSSPLRRLLFPELGAPSPALWSRAFGNFRKLVGRLWLCIPRASFGTECTLGSFQKFRVSGLSLCSPVLLAHARPTPESLGRL